ncbi:unnamed protein product [Nippostrongylus brasiliensis]|uniref:Secreted protein n=1 Tax=Nippostrongylus brasiliensis TaxID=27835 RepID=A0A0N4YAU4_NIPBR|nr:unnamed protein product [Nippostrongylus brasiliensis]
MPSLMGHSYILSISSLVLMRADLGEDKMHPAISTDVQVLERCQSRSFIVVGKPTETSGNRDAEDVALQQHQVPTESHTWTVYESVRMELHWSARSLDSIPFASPGHYVDFPVITYHC